MPDVIPQPNLALGEYVLDQRIGRGATGEVWKAHHHVWNQRVVAIKIPTNPEFLRGLIREGVIHEDLTRIDSPHIVRLLGLNVQARPPYIIMEYVSGQSLRERLRAGRMALPEALRVYEGILKGLAAAHQAGVIHRDIKPENILFDQAGTPKLSDFSIALKEPGADSLRMSLETDPEAAPSLAGTLVYMSPEQRQGGRIDRRSDIYSMGLLLFEILTGELPQPGDRIADFVPDIPPVIDQLFQRCFTRYDRRFADGPALLTAVQELRAGKPALPTLKIDKPATAAAEAANIAARRVTAKPAPISTRDLPLAEPPAGQSAVPPAAPAQRGPHAVFSTRDLASAPPRGREANSDAPGNGQSGANPPAAASSGQRSPSSGRLPAVRRAISTRDMAGGESGAEESPAHKGAKSVAAGSAARATPAGVQDLNRLLNELPDDIAAGPVRRTADPRVSRQYSEVLPSLEALYRRHFTSDAQRLVAGGHYAQAVDMYKRLLLNSPGDYKTMRGLALCLSKTNRPKEALSYYRQLLEMAPDSAEIWNAVGALEMSIGRVKEAERALLTAVELKPRYASAHSNLGAVYQAQGRADDARREATIALEIDPDLFEASYNLGVNS